VADAALGKVWEPPATVAVDVLPAAFFALVCDGMGGEAGGALASGLAVDATAAAMRAAYEARSALPPGSLSLVEARAARALVASLEAASARIKQAAREEPAYARMGTTATLATVIGSSLLCAQVGDSRAYVFHAGALVQVTRDQTMLELLRSSGALAPGGGTDMVGAHVILQALGSSAQLDVPITRAPLVPGDRVLLCSDGLHGCVTDDEIASVLRSLTSAADACDALVALANEHGGPDNISVVVFDVDEER